MSIHPTAIIEDGARLGERVRIGPYCVVSRDAEIGDGCILGPHVVIHAYAALGPECRVHAGAVLGDLPQDLAFRDEPSRVRIGRGCVIREGVTVHRGTKPGTETVVGDECYLMVNSHLGHNVQLGRRVIVANGTLLAGYVEVGDGAVLSANVLAHQFVRIGRLAMLSGGCGIGKDVPPFCIGRGLSVNDLGGVNVVGLRRAGIGPAERLQVRNAYRILFRSGLNVSQAVARIRAEIPPGPAQEMCDFIEQSHRGICSHGGAEEESEVPGF